MINPYSKKFELFMTTLGIITAIIVSYFTARFVINSQPSSDKGNQNWNQDACENISKNFNE